MQISTVHTLDFTIRAANGLNQLAEQIIKAACESLKITFGEIKGQPLPNPTDDAGSVAVTVDPAKRTSKVSVFSDSEDQLRLYWTQIEQALNLVGVETSSP